MMDKMKNIIYICGALLLFFCGCTEESRLRETSPEGALEVRLTAMGMLEGETSGVESVVNEVAGFRFEEGVLKEVFEKLVPDGEGTCHLRPLQMRGTVYFLANASDIIRKAALQVEAATLGDFLDLQATATEMTASGIAMSGKVELTPETTSAKVALKRSVSRIDLDSPFEGVKVERVKIKNIVPLGYVNEREEGEAPVGAEPEALVKDFGETPLENGKQTVFYLCEQGKGGYEVELVVTSADGAWHRLKTTLTALMRNTVYTLKVYGNGADIRVEVLTDDWENGDSSETEQVLKGWVDKTASEWSEGVTINERGDTVFVPYLGGSLRLVLKAEEGANLVVNGIADGVTVVPQTLVRGMNPVAEVSVESRKKMPGDAQEYIYLDLYNQEQLQGRVVLVFLSHPIRLSGKMKFDSDAVCDFGNYMDGELGVMTLPEGKVLKLEIPDGEAPWMKIEKSSEQAAYRIIAGWKPNDPTADGRVQEARLLVADADGSHPETYTVKRQNWGLPVVNVNGTWWCKYNLRGNVKRFSDQILVKDEPATDGQTLFEYLKNCSDEELLLAMGYQYQAGNLDGLPLAHDSSRFYYEGFQTAVSGNFGTMPPGTMAPEGYQIPDFDDFRFFAWGTDCNLGYNESGAFNNNLGQRLNYSVAERTLTVDGAAYGAVGVYDFVYNGVHCTFLGLGHQYDAQNIVPMKILFATYGNANSTWGIEGYTKSDGRGNWIKFDAQNALKTRTIRCVKTPVEYVYE